MFILFRSTFDSGRDIWDFLLFISLNCKVLCVLDISIFFLFWAEDSKCFFAGVTFNVSQPMKKKERVRYSQATHKRLNLTYVVPIYGPHYQVSAMDRDSAKKTRPCHALSIIANRHTHGWGTMGQKSLRSRKRIFLFQYLKSNKTVSKLVGHRFSHSVPLTT